MYYEAGFMGLMTQHYAQVQSACYIIGILTNDARNYSTILEPSLTRQASKFNESQFILPGFFSLHVAIFRNIY